MSDPRASKRRPKKPLPHGWIERASKTYSDRVYYYNTITHCSTWEHPSRPKSERKSGVSRQTLKSSRNKKQGITSSQNKQSMVEKEHVSEALPENRLGLIDEDSMMMVDEDNEIEDYDEEHNLQFDNVPIHHFSLSHSHNTSKQSSPAGSPKVDSSPCSSVPGNSGGLLLWNDEKKTSNVKRPFTSSELEPFSKKIKTLLSLPKKNVNEVTSKGLPKNIFNQQLAKNKSAVHDIGNYNISSCKSNDKLKISSAGKCELQSRLKNNERQDSSVNALKSSEVASSKISSQITDKLSSRSKSYSQNRKTEKTPAQNRLQKVRVQQAGKQKKELPSGKKEAEFKNLISSKQPSKELFKKEGISNKEAEWGSSDIFIRGASNLSSRMARARDSVTNSERLKDSPQKLNDFCTQVEQTPHELSTVFLCLEKIDNFEPEAMDWEPSDQEKMIEIINNIRREGTELPSDIAFNKGVILAPNQLTESVSWFLVLDTNVLISCLGFVKDIRDTEVRGLGYPVLYIPWRVLQELDHLKDSKTNMPLKRSARMAISYLNENFTSRHPRVRGQSLEQFSSMGNLGPGVPDDDILQSCIQLQKAENTKALILLTNDKNLESKAVISGVRVFSKDRFQKEVAEVSKNSSSNEKMVVASDSTQCGIDYLYCELKKILKNLFTEVLETELKLAFHNDWQQLCYRKPPWDLQDTVDCIIKHWISVFSSVYPRSLKNEIDRLQKVLKRDALSEVADTFEISQRVIMQMQDCSSPRAFAELLLTSQHEVNRLKEAFDRSAKKYDLVKETDGIVAGAASSWSGLGNQSFGAYFSESWENPNGMGHNEKYIKTHVESYCCLITKGNDHPEVTRLKLFGDHLSSSALTMRAVS